MYTALGPGSNLRPPGRFDASSMVGSLLALATPAGASSAGTPRSGPDPGAGSNALGLTWMYGRHAAGIATACWTAEANDSCVAAPPACGCPAKKQSGAGTETIAGAPTLAGLRASSSLDDDATDRCVAGIVGAPLEGGWQDSEVLTCSRAVPGAPRAGNPKASEDSWIESQGLARSDDSRASAPFFLGLRLRKRLIGDAQSSKNLYGAGSGQHSGVCSP